MLMNAMPNGNIAIPFTRKVLTWPTLLEHAGAQDSVAQGLARRPGDPVRAAHVCFPRIHVWLCAFLASPPLAS